VARTTALWQRDRLQRVEAVWKGAAAVGLLSPTDERRGVFEQDGRGRQNARIASISEAIPMRLIIRFML